MEVLVEVLVEVLAEVLVEVLVEVLLEMLAEAGSMVIVSVVLTRDEASGVYFQLKGTGIAWHFGTDPSLKAGGKWYTGSCIA